MTDHFDAIVVGSGFGGSVSAFELAKGGKKVCLMERGRSYPPGSFPRAPHDLNQNFWDPSAGLYGLYNVWSFKTMGAIVSSGLGGGSLIYANVLIRKDPTWFVQKTDDVNGHEYWPITYEELEPHYDAVEPMLGAQPYPFANAPFDRTPKTRAFKEAAEQMGLNWSLPNLAVTFRPDASSNPTTGEPIQEALPNLHGRTRYTCRLVAECDLGCNYGSKNSLDYNYLTHAKHQGAELWTSCEVRRFEPRPEGGFDVYYVNHNVDDSSEVRDVLRTPAESRISADRLILASGTFGTTYLLLKMRAAGGLPAISSTLGTHFSGNGDFLGFVFGSRKRVNGGWQPRVLNPNLGTVITSTLRVPDAEDRPQSQALGSERGFYIQDAGFPAFLSWIAEASQVPSGLRRGARFGWWWLRNVLSKDPDSDMGAELRDLLGRGDFSSTMMPLLAMGRDVPDGRMSLTRSGRLALTGNLKSSAAYFERVRETMKDLATALNGRYRDDPVWLLKRLITVHPLGGAPMGRTIDEGVVDSYGRVFGGPGMYVADGSVMPGSVGPNPSLTIAAFARRVAHGILEESS